MTLSVTRRAPHLEFVDHGPVCESERWVVVVLEQIGAPTVHASCAVTLVDNAALAPGREPTSMSRVDRLSVDVVDEGADERVVDERGDRM